VRRESKRKNKFVLPFGSKLNTGLLSSILFALVFHLGVLIIAFAYRDYSVSAAMSFEGSSRFVADLTFIEDSIEEEEDVLESSSKSGGNEEGKFGEIDEVLKSKVPLKEGELVDRFKDVGVLKAVSSLSADGALSSVFGDRSSFSEQLSAAAMGGDDGELLIGHGAGGMGLRGSGIGGGSKGFGRIHGLGSIDTGGGGRGRGRLGSRKSARKKFAVKRGKPSVGNYCKSSDILRVVSSRQRSIQYCYEKELARNPELRGKLIVNWRIGLNGKVMKAWVGSSSLRNGSVESCITRSVKRWTFNKPEGGICEIKFPFVFNQGF
jgi:hypothetical protein